MENKKAFTLVELIAVIAILGMIMIIAVPKVYNSIVSNKKRTFIINAKNIVRQLEYDNLEFNTFTKIPLEDLGLKKISSKNIDLKNSVAYIVDDEIVLDLVGKSDYKDFYLCNLAYTNEDYIVQNTPCDKEHNFIYIDFVVDLDGGSTSQNFNTKYLSGNYLVLEIPKKPNDTFLGWELVSGNSILDQNRIKFGTENTRIKAIWGNNPELVVNLNGRTTNQKFDSKYSGGSLIILQEPTREGYKFKGWNIVVGNAILSGNIITTGTTNTVIEAVWELSEFNISYELNGGTKGENAPSKGKGGSSVIISNPTKLGYTFTGWDVIGTGSSISGTILTIGSQDVILVANWEIDNYLISYNLNGGNATENPSNYTIETDTFTLNNPSKTGYTFKGWTGSNGSTANTSVSVPKGSTGDKTYTANYTMNTYTISYNLNGGTVSTANKTSYTVETSTFMLNNPSKTGYTFKGWTGSNGSTANTSVSIAKGSTGDKTYTANYQVNTYSISYNLNGGTAGSSAPTSGTYGSVVTISNPTRSGYTFKGWELSGNGAILSGTNLTLGDGNVTLIATWYKFPVLASNYPANKEVVIHNSVSSEIIISEAGDPASYTYQWYKNGQLVSGATSTSYTFTPTTVGSTTLYCKVTNSAGTVTTRTATITSIGYYVVKKGLSNVSISRNGVTTNTSSSVMSISQSVSLRDAPLYANFGPINVTKYKTLNIQFTDTYLNTAYPNNVGLSTSVNNSSPTVVSTISSGYASKKTIDVSGLSGNYYIIFRIESGSGGVGSRYMNVSNIWFE